MGNVLPGEVTKIWEVQADGGRHFVQLRHHTITGGRVVLLDGKEIYSGTKFVDDGEIIPFDIGSDRCKIVIGTDATVFVYSMFIKDEPVADMVSKSMEYKDVPVKLSIPSFEKVPEGKTMAVIYHVQVTIGDDKTFLLNRRFRDFDALNNKIRSAYASNHLLANLPAFPRKYPKFWYDHFAIEFIQERAEQLEVYMRKLLQVPKVVHNPDLHRFLTPEEAPAVTSDAAVDTLRSGAGGASTGHGNGSAAGATPHTPSSAIRLRTRTDSADERHEVDLNDDSSTAAAGPGKARTPSKQQQQQTQMGQSSFSSRFSRGTSYADVADFEDRSGNGGDRDQHDVDL